MCTSQSRDRMSRGCCSRSGMTVGCSPSLHTRHRIGMSRSCNRSFRVPSRSSGRACSRMQLRHTRSGMCRSVAQCIARARCSSQHLRKAQSCRQIQPTRARKRTWATAEAQHTDRVHCIRSGQGTLEHCSRHRSKIRSCMCKLLATCRSRVRRSHSIPLAHCTPASRSSGRSTRPCSCMCPDSRMSRVQSMIQRSCMSASSSLPRPIRRCMCIGQARCMSPFLSTDSSKQVTRTWVRSTRSRNCTHQARCKSRAQCNRQRTREPRTGFLSRSTCSCMCPVLCIAHDSCNRSLQCKSASSSRSPSIRNSTSTR